MSKNTAPDFETVKPDYDADDFTPLAITITNTGTSAAAGLSAALSGGNAESFTLSNDSETGQTIAIADISAGGTAAFTVVPVTGLEEGVYTATVTVSGADDTGAEVDVWFRVRDNIPAHEIELSINGNYDIESYDFETVNPGYYPLEPLTVTVTNTGTESTGQVGAALLGFPLGTVFGEATNFTVNTASIADIAPNEAAAFTVVPKNDLPAGSYEAVFVVAITNGEGWPWDSPGFVWDEISNDNYVWDYISVNFEVDAPSSYSFTVSVNGSLVEESYDFGMTDKEYDYALPAPLTVTVTNTGYDRDGYYLSLPGGAFLANGYFGTLYSGSIKPGGTASFSVVPSTNLQAGTYTDVITVSGTPDNPVSFEVRFRVRKAYEITLSVDGLSEYVSGVISYDFGTADMGYEPATLTVNVTNTGANPTGALDVSLYPNSEGSFTLDTEPIADIEPEGTAEFTVAPAKGLPAGTYTAHILVRRESPYLYESLNVSFTVMSLPADLEEAADALTGPSGTTQAEPILLEVNLGIGQWETLLHIIKDAGKYVALDLSAGAVPDGGTTFYPGDYNTGEQYIVSLVLPDAARSIGFTPNRPQFKNFTSLAYVSGANIRIIGAYAFTGCSALETADFPLAASIGDFAFADYRAEDVTYPSPVLKRVNFPLVTSIGTGVFQNCSTLETAEFPEAASIPEYTFSGCSALTMVDFPKATTIGQATSMSGPFRGCVALKTVNIPKAASIGQDTFSGCSALETADFPEAASIGANAFSGCSALKTADFPEAASIGGTAFYGCSVLETANIPKAASIGQYAFVGCSALETADFPLVTSIDRRAFAGCSALETAKFPLLTSISEDVFSKCTALTTVFFPLVTSISDNYLIYEGAFAGCSALETAEFPLVTSIGNNAFRLCSALKTADFPKAASIGKEAFGGCSALKTADFPKAVSIGEGAFAGCLALTMVNIPATSIGEEAFRVCTSLTEVSFSSVETIGASAFAGCSALETADFPEAITIGEKAFHTYDSSGFMSDSTALKTANFPKATSIGKAAFAGHSALEIVDFRKAAFIDDDAFAGCSTLETADFPEAVSIGNSAFSGCSALETADFPKAASIGNYAFANCSALETANFSAVTSIGNYAFYLTAGTAFAITLPQAAPTIVSQSTAGNPYTMAVTVKTPADKTGYDATWESAFKQNLNSNAITITYETIEEE